MPTLYVILGPTAVGKTAYAIRLAQELGTEILSCDSRQFYEELNIGVARPSPEELRAVPHHLVASRSIHNPYNVFDFEQDALRCLEGIFSHHDVAVAVGGSGLYVEALCQGVAQLPDPAPGLREHLSHQIATQGIQPLLDLLQRLDPEYFQIVDRRNPVRVQRALEVCLTANKPFSELLKQPVRPRPFDIERRVLSMPNERLKERIYLRVDQMLESGLEAEARALFPFRTLQPLNTVGYKEFFSAWDINPSVTPLSLVSQQIKDHTWQYARKQMTWLRKKAPNCEVQV